MTKTFITAQSDPHEALREFNTNSGIGHENASLAEPWEDEPTPVTNDEEDNNSLATEDWEL
ncbi:hypothetical protein [Actibacterium sp. XHP0104]|uniref:hypothetical protein n=1 Tax=Actibacterium sp. XHP0104 TaxID=2984335 RepID=UPI0021E7EE36|nr:hypothetical protein [Actibacterium sp. XHP0104]MCV2881702.1 hypothetical protein [Actibacterium sp. XHP0104]